MERYKDSSEKIEDILGPLGTKIGENKTEKELKTKPRWFSLIYRGKYNSYGFIGCGIGKVKIEKTSTINNTTSTDVSDIFNGWQILTGLGGPHANLCFKYTKIKTNATWSNANFGGLTATLSIFF